jgi:NAD(P)-dependent dehydrogenase (short-subunit alcohol dehydrogenase family)
MRLTRGPTRDSPWRDAAIPSGKVFPDSDWRVRLSCEPQLDGRDQLDARREQLRTTLPIRRVVGPDDIAALAVHLMTNTAVTGATFDIDGGRQLVEV